MDILESTDKDGNIMNSEHTRMRGIPTACIKYKANQYKTTVVELYEKLYNNEMIEFDLTNDGDKFVCRNNKDHTVSNLRKGASGSTRKAKFIRNGNHKSYMN